MEAGSMQHTAPLKGQGEVPYLAEPAPGFIPVEIHRDALAREREQALAAGEFHRRKANEAEAVVVSCDSALGTLKELLGIESPGRDSGR